MIPSKLYKCPVARTLMDIYDAINSELSRTKKCEFEEGEI